LGGKLAQEGYFVMAINYRLSTPSYSTYPGVLADIEMAMNWLVFNANTWKIDVGKIGLIGDSAGAYLAALFALKHQTFSYTISSVIGVYGVYDLVEECIYPVIERETNMFERFLGFTFKENERAFTDASPTTYINGAAGSPTFDTNFFLIWGGTDKVLNPRQSKIFYEKLRKANIGVEIAEIKDKGHFWFNQLPGIKAGIVNDYPNNILENNVQNAESGNFSRKQLNTLANIEDLTKST